MGPEHWWWWGGMWMFPIMPIIMLIVVVLVLYLLLGRSPMRGPCGDWSRYPAPGVDYESPLEILKKRYARGEITKEEFEQMKKDIGGIQLTPVTTRCSGKFNDKISLFHGP